MWVQFPSLRLNLWTPIGISKIASIIGNPITTDKLTATRQRLSYARVLLEVELPLKEALPDIIEIQGPDGKIYNQKVIYEFKPRWCSWCNVVGHETVNCRRHTSKKIWVPVSKQSNKDVQEKLVPSHDAQKNLQQRNVEDNVNFGQTSRMSGTLEQEAGSVSGKHAHQVQDARISISAPMTEGLLPDKVGMQLVGDANQTMAGFLPLQRKHAQTSLPGKQLQKGKLTSMQKAYHSSPSINFDGFTSVTRTAKRAVMSADSSIQTSLGFNKTSKHGIVKKFIQEYKISLLALLETKVAGSDKLQAIGNKIAKDWKWLSNINASNKVKSKDGNLACLITAVYAFNQAEGRKSLWEELISFKGNVNCPWLVGGDFNAIINSDEKIGGNQMNDAGADDFQNFINSSQLRNIKTTGCFYTWSNKQDSASRVWSRLDRILINDEWIFKHTASQAEYLMPLCSDHSPGLITIDDTKFVGKKPFKFFNMWAKHPNFLDMVKSVWNKDIRGYNMYRFHTKLKNLKPVLKDLNKKYFMDISQQVIRAQAELNEVQVKLYSDLFNSELIAKEKECTKKYINLLDCENSFYRHKANIKWALNADKGSHLFHSVMKNKRHQNKVLTLYSEDGLRLTDIDDITAAKRTCIWLLKSSLHQIISKIIASRLQKVIGYLINEAQSAFVKGRLISSNFLLAHELIKQYSRKNNSPRAILNMDLRKAFDTISWEFIRAMLMGLGFPNTMTEWIMECISSSKFSLALNGGLHGYFQGARGLRQGDPLSPYLFVIGMEYLSRKLSSLNTDKCFRFHPKCSKLKITHLVFADDLLLFSRADMISVLKITACFKEFSLVSGLEENLAKCSVYFSGVDDNIKNQICDFLGFKEGVLPMKYLGLPLSAKGLSYVDCSSLIGKIQDQFQFWQKNRKLSYAGKLEMIKSVILGIQTFWMSNYILPIRVLEKIDSLCSQFLWNSKMHLISWNTICQGKKQGGLGIFSAKEWNLATAAKLLWMLHLKKDLLWIKWIHENYLQNQDIWTVQPRLNDSWMWKRLIKVRDILVNRFGSVERVKITINECCSNGKVLLSAMYRVLIQPSPRVNWHETVWDGLLYPKRLRSGT
ncbi:uncharacterized protein LOC109820840 [Asparagus officinalis]|uniref:uncharacterized protein LOC109820840 n=1 Tax=Asparagus officinalis TaxID=4686 RepID=UPI00098E100F|nr:uncharacterized protein LOC109820840 [Asparagus officinalis]